MSTIVAYPARPGHGGLGQHSEQVLQALTASGIGPVEAYGPAPLEACGRYRGVSCTEPPSFMPDWYRRYTPYRYATGRYQFSSDRRFGRWLASQVRTRALTRAYLLTQIAEETLRLARSRAASSILDSPTGHIRDYYEASKRESQRWVKWPYVGHPSARTVDRVEREYELADRIRVSSGWSMTSLVRRGIAAEKIFVAPQQVDTARFTPSLRPPPPDGPVRIAFVGSFSLAKGFQYLLEAVRRAGPRHFRIEMVGATGDIWSRRLLARLGAGLDLTHSPGSPLDALQRSELFVFPTLHDGFGLAVGEALACGLPVITTDCCGAAEWFAGVDAGWIVPAGDLDALVASLVRSLDERGRLAEMGARARQTAERLNTVDQRDTLVRKIAACWRSDTMRPSS